MSDTPAPPAPYPAGPRSRATRARGRMSYDRDAVHAVLDEAWVCHLAFTVDGEPRVLPTLHARVGETLYLHGSSGSRLGLTAAREHGIDVCAAVTLLDGLVYGRAQLHHSANYRSVVAHGTARYVADRAEKLTALTALVERTGPGRSTDSRPPDRKELAETAVLALPLREVSLRSRTGGVRDDAADLALPHWAGVVPLAVVAGAPVPDGGVRNPPPGYLPGVG